MPGGQARGALAQGPALVGENGASSPSINGDNSPPRGASKGSEEAMEACAGSLIHPHRAQSERGSLPWGRQALRWAERTHCGP